MKFLNNWDLTRNQLLNAVIQNLATAPANPVKGLIYFNTTDNKYYGWDGTSWKDLGKEGIEAHALSGEYHTGDLAYDQIDSLVNTTGEGADNKLPSSNHTHTGADGTSKVSYANLTNIPASFTPSAHASTHIGGTDPIANASTSSAGLMSKEDKTKLDGIQAGAEVNQNAFSTIAVSGQTSIEADTKTDTLTLANGTGITITTDAANDKVTITAHEHSNKALLDSYTQTETNLADAVAKKHSQNTDSGTSQSSFYIGTDGPRIKNDNGQIQIRNNDDTGFADLKVNNLFVEGTQTIINSNEVNIGDNIIKLNADITSATLNSDGGIEVKRLKSDNTTEGNAAILFNESLDKWQVTEGAPENVQTFDIARKYTATVGDGTATSFVLTHNLNTRDIAVTIRETSTPYAQVITDVEFTSVNTITINFAQPPTVDQYTVTLVG
ncbi:MAG TPA: hypothetical protein PLS98_08765 [Dictyoglomaceae bacterium]|nr:hypothetical protein [Dictyoglomaceae bacterium]